MSHLKILGFTRVPLRKFRMQDKQILDTNVQNVVASATWHMELVYIFSWVYIISITTLSSSSSSYHLVQALFFISNIFLIRWSHSVVLNGRRNGLPSLSNNIKPTGIYLYDAKITLTTRNRLLRETIIIPQLIKKFPEFYKLRNFTSFFKTDCHLPPLSVRSIHSTPFIQFLNPI